MLMRNPCECRKYPGTTIVTDSVTSNGLTQFIKDQGGKHFRYKRGYKNVISKGIELNEQGEETNLMMETRCALSATDLSMVVSGGQFAIIITVLVRPQIAGAH